MFVEEALLRIKKRNSTPRAFKSVRRSVKMPSYARARVDRFALIVLTLSDTCHATNLSIGAESEGDSFVRVRHDQYHV